MTFRRYGGATVNDCQCRRLSCYHYAGLGLAERRMWIQTLAQHGRIDKWVNSARWVLKELQPWNGDWGGGSCVQLVNHCWASHGITTSKVVINGSKDALYRLLPLGNIIFNQVLVWLSYYTVHSFWFCNLGCDTEGKGSTRAQVMIGTS